jgi:hypothetical protein
VGEGGVAGCGEGGGGAVVDDSYEEGVGVAVLIFFFSYVIWHID